MLIVLTRVFLIYLFLFIVMRLMGKKQLGELQPFEFTITLVAAELACIPMSDIQVPILYGIVPILALLIIEILMTKLVKKSIFLRKAINGKPSIVITPKGIDYGELSKLDMTIHDLLESLRASSYLSPSEVEYAIVETNGNVSCIPKAQNKPATVSDVNGKIEPVVMPYSIICEGKDIPDNYKKANVEENKVKTLLKNNNLAKKDVLLLTVADGKDYYLQPIKGEYIQGSFSEDCA